MEPIQKDILSNEEKEILQEVMNIAFGKATADLADVINTYVVMSVPGVIVVPAANLLRYIEEELKDFGDIDMVKQHFWGKFKGIAFLVLSSGSGKKLISLMQDGADSFGDSHLHALEKETLIETGNIIIGACIGKLSELLGDIVTYSPPAAIIEKNCLDSIPKDIFDPNHSAIILRTVFCFEKEDVSGFLFLVTSDESINWLKGALSNFLDQYE